MDSSTLQYVALWAPVVVTVSTVATLLWGVWTYRRNAQSQMQLQALSALQHYLDLAVARPDLASRPEDHPVDAPYAWFAAHALVTA